MISFRDIDEINRKFVKFDCVYYTSINKSNIYDKVIDEHA